MWQDIVFTAGSLVFIVALARMVLATDKPPLFSSVSTGLTLAAFAVCYGTLGLPFACATTALSALLWLTLAVQRIRSTA